MKRTGGLWESILSFENLWLAYRRARLGKRNRPTVMAFGADLESELLRLHDELRTGSYRPGAYRQFWIQDPKRRLISAAPFRDRVVHHALCSHIGPVFERGFIAHSYANRVGYGTHRALGCFAGFLRSSRFVLQCDIRKYFPSMDHAILKTLIRRKIKCPGTLWLVDTILDHAPPQEEARAFFTGDDLFSACSRRIGLPIGNLTSQLWANVYLDGFDHFVKESLRIRKYLRYVDDFALFSDDREELAAALPAIRARLADLHLVLHPSKTRLAPTAEGACALGFRVLQDRIRVRAENLRRGRRRLRTYQRSFAAGTLDLEQLSQRVRAWGAHLAHANSWRLRERIFAGLVFRSPRKGGGASGFARRFMEQQHQELPLGEPQQERPHEPEQQHRVPCRSGCALQHTCTPEPGDGNLRGAPGVSRPPSWEDP